MFLTLIKAKYKIEAKVKNGDFSGETYWTCFAYDEDPDDLHCTHKFLAELEPEELEEVKKILTDHFAKEPFREFTVAFTEEEFFGENKDVRVLTPVEAVEAPWRLDLRSKLDAFHKDWFPNWQPHVTTDLDRVEKSFTRYCLCRGDDILLEFKA